MAQSSILQAARVADAPRRLGLCRRAIQYKDFLLLTAIIEEDSNLMHAVMMTSKPPLFYWEPVSLQIIKAIPQWRKENIPVCYTLDAGANVHCICPSEYSFEVKRRLEQIPGVIQILTAAPGNGVQLVNNC